MPGSEFFKSVTFHLLHPEGTVLTTPSVAGRLRLLEVFCSLQGRFPRSFDRESVKIQEPAYLFLK